MTPNHQGQSRPEILDRFEDFLLASRGLAITSVQLNVGFIRRAIREIGESPTANEIETYVATLRKRGANFGTVSNAIKALDHFATFLGTKVQLQRPREPKRIPVSPLSEAKIAVIIAVGCKTIREKAIVSLLAYSGVRNSELRSLRVRDFKIDQQAIFVDQGKESKDRLVFIAGDCSALLLKYLGTFQHDQDSFLFMTMRHKVQLQSQSLRKIVKVCAKRAGVDLRVFPHLFRHSSASALLDRGASWLTVMEQLGHAHIQTTMRYVHSMKRRRKAEYEQFAPSYL